MAGLRPGRPDDLSSRGRPGAQHVEDQVAVHVDHQLAVAAPDALAGELVVAEPFRSVFWPS